MMLVSDMRGKIVYCTTDMAEHLHYEPRQLHGMSIQKLMAQPFGQMHTKWMKSQSARIPTGSCRGNATVVISDANGVSGDDDLVEAQSPSLRVAGVDDAVHSRWWWWWRSQ